MSAIDRFHEIVDDRITDAFAYGEKERLRRNKEMVRESWRLWQVHSCIEWNREHDWHLHIETGSMGLVCTYCPATQEDLAPDSSECFVAHIPVIVTEESVHYPGGPWGADEYDYFVYLEPRDEPS